MQASATVSTPIPANLTATLEHTEYVKGTYEVEWKDYALTITSRGRDYRIATLTEYPNGRSMVTYDVSIRTSTAWAAWYNLVRAVGGDKETRARFYVYEGQES